LWLDNDEAGRKFEKAFTENLQAINPNITFSRMNNIYDGFKDLNAWHTDSNIDLSSKNKILRQFVKPLHAKAIEPNMIRSVSR
jgi:hypothetical protein